MQLDIFLHWDCQPLYMFKHNKSFMSAESYTSITSATHIRENVYILKQIGLNKVSCHLELLPEVFQKEYRQLEHLRQTPETNCSGMKQSRSRSMLVNNHCYLMNMTWHAPFVLQPGQVSHDSPLCGYSEKSSSNLKSRSCKCQSLHVTSACGVIVVVLYVNVLILR